jgi:prepilin-type N-terminal cleavage/methylation domain-containing protein
LAWIETFSLNDARTGVKLFLSISPQFLSKGDAMRSRHNFSARGGFTLIELLVAAAMGSIVVAATGIGLMAILRSDARSESLTRQRTELSRALDFIGEETKMATAIGSSGSELGEFDCNNASVVLTLDIPSVDPGIVYYTKPVSSDSN